MQRFETLWEAIKIIKNNEETLAIKILKQDAVLKKLPVDTIERLRMYIYLHIYLDGMTNALLIIFVNIYRKNPCGKP